jgi:hypothetical protein
MVRLNLSTFPFVRGVCGRVYLCFVPVPAGASLKTFDRYAGPLSVRHRLMVAMPCSRKNSTARSQNAPAVPARSSAWTSA